jgi:drug/metabolite transporter (DMT)-like permease
VSPPQRPFFAIALRLSSAFAFSVMFLLVKLAVQSGIKVPEVLFWRQAMTAPALFLWLVAQGQLHRLRTDRIGAHALRAGVGMSNLAIVFTATALLPLAEVTTLGFATPLFAVVIAAAVLGEQIGPWRWGAVLLGFLGVLVIAQPGSSPIDPLGATLALFGALLVAVINFQIRDLGRTEEPIRVVFWFGLFGMLATALVLPWFASAHDGYQWLLLGGIGLSGLIGQLGLTASLRFAPVSTVIVMDYSTLIWATLFGWLAWGTLPGQATWLGAPLIVGAGLLIVWRERQRSATSAAVNAVD